MRHNWLLYFSPGSTSTTLQVSYLSATVCDILRHVKHHINNSGVILVMHAIVWDWNQTSEQIYKNSTIKMITRRNCCCRGTLLLCLVWCWEGILINYCKIFLNSSKWLQNNLWIRLWISPTCLPRQIPPSSIVWGHIFLFNSVVEMNSIVHSGVGRCQQMYFFQWVQKTHLPQRPGTL